MAEDDVAGPARLFKGNGGSQAPLYLLAFDKAGHCTSPRTRALVLDELASGRFTDLHIYSHGWNNVFNEAVAHYGEFFSEYFGLAPAAALGGRPYRPLLVGLIWPSTALLAPGEETPAIAGFGATSAPPELAILEDELSPAAAQRLGELAARPGPLAGDDALLLAGLLEPVLAGHAAGDDEGAIPDADPGALLLDWGSALPSSTGAATDAAAPEAGGLLGFLNPREILRKATVFLMKDRAGTVGRAGVGDLLRDAVALRKTRVHLTGHSYGAKVVLSALSRLPAGERVSSVLLLQPAISARCFAERIPEHGNQPGFYRHALDQTVAPLCTTFSPHDSALTRFYPLALRRGRDVGEIEPGAPTSPFAALGAVGPQGVAPGELAVGPILAPPGVYPPPAPGIRVRALDGATGIGSHGDVRNHYTEWALASLVRQGATP